MRFNLGVSVVMVQTDLIVYEGTLSTVKREMDRFAAILWISICLSPVESFASLISLHRSELKACPSQRKRQVVTNRDFNVQLSQSVPDDMIGEEKVNSLSYGQFPKQYPFVNILELLL